MNVAELIKLLQVQDPEAIVAAGHLGITGWFSTFDGISVSEYGDVVLSMVEETVHTDEVDVAHWTRGDYPRP